MLTIDEMIANRNTLAKHLASMKEEPYFDRYAMEYGIPTEPGGFMSYLRIRWMNTAGGWQFRLCELYNGREGSGDYTPEISEMLLKAEQMVQHYHRTVQSSVLRQALIERRMKARTPDGQPVRDYRKELCWFKTIPGEVHGTVTGRFSSHDPLHGEVIVTLPAPR